MSRLVPIGYQTFHEAVAEIEQAIFAGMPDRAIVNKVRQLEGDVADGEANKQARLPKLDGRHLAHFGAYAGALGVRAECERWGRRLFCVL
jgi:hypothetical protein